MRESTQRIVLAVSHACILQVNRSVYRELQALGWNVHIVIPEVWHANGKAKPAEPGTDDDPKIHPLPLQGSNPRSYYFRGLSALIGSVGPAIIFADVDPVSRLAFQLGRECQKRGIRLVCLSCENLPFDVPSVVRREGAKAVFAGALKQALGALNRRHVDHVFTISSAGTRIFQAAGFRSVSQIPLGFSSRIFFPDAERREAIRDRLKVSGAVLAYIGRMVPEKGIHLFLDSLRELIDLEWTLLLDHFETQQNSYLEHVASVGREPWIRERVRFIEADHREIADYMRATDIVAMPSISTRKWKEQYGRVAPEAMACGCVVVASDSGTLPELVSDAGVIFPEGDVAALTAAIRGLIQNPVRMRQIGGTAALRARNSLSISSQAEQMSSVFESLVTENQHQLPRRPGIVRD
jgi:glycosyltransferase involved in cell wall biosynthesis